MPRTFVFALASALFLSAAVAPVQAQEPGRPAPDSARAADSVARRTRARELWAKVPPSFAVDELPGAEPEAYFGEAAGDVRRVKLVLLRWPISRAQG